MASDLSAKIHHVCEACHAVLTNRMYLAVITSVPVVAMLAGAILAVAVIYVQHGKLFGEYVHIDNSRQIIIVEVEPRHRSGMEIFPVIPDKDIPDDNIFDEYSGMHAVSARAPFVHTTLREKIRAYAERH